MMLLSAVMACGCAGLQDYQYNRIQKHRADVAWRECYGSFNSSVSKDYRDGWKQGYTDLSRGMCDELPAVPPSKYWAASYQSEEGRCCIDQWYAGWRDGADAAKACGTPEWHRIAPSPTAPSPAENAALTQTAQTMPGPSGPAMNGEVQMAQRPKLNMLPNTQPSFKQAPPLPEEVEVAPPMEPTTDPELQPSISVRPVNGEIDAAVEENYAVPPAMNSEAVGEGVEGS
jgi:hypothetical protein